MTRRQQTRRGKDETNTYADQSSKVQQDAGKQNRYSRSKVWKQVTILEMRKISWPDVLNRVVVKPELQLYWSTDELMQTLIFPKICQEIGLRLFCRTYTSTIMCSGHLIPRFRYRKGVCLSTHQDIIIIIIYTTYIAPYIWPVWPFIGAEEGPSKY